MCDNILAPPDSTAERVMLFGKNSDRQRNEAQSVELFPSVDSELDAQVSCTHLTIPQARRTHAVLLCRPFWIWGAEMGANEHGVVIGNEGVHARGGAPQLPALTGMDLVRLALERASTAAEAVDVIAELLARYGQGGNCGHLVPSYYHNSFMIADSGEAFVLETVGKEWLLEPVSGVRSISNRYSIARGARRTSAGLAGLIRDSGWSTESDLNYAAVIADPDREHIGTSGARQARSTGLMRMRDARLTAADMMSILRDHGGEDDCQQQWRDECTIKRTICMHAGAEDHAGQTVGSMVSEIANQGAVHWVTGTAAACTSIFKPVFLDAPLPPHGPLPTDRFDPRTLWWRHERLHRAAALGDFHNLLEHIRPERDALEADFRRRVRAVLNGGSAADRARVAIECWKQALELEDQWYAHTIKPIISNETLPTHAWLKLNQLAGVEW